MMAHNYKTWGDLRLARATWICGLALSFVMVEMYFFSPSGLPAYIYIMIAATVLAYIAYHKQKPKLDAVLEDVSQRQTADKVMVVALLSLMSITALGAGMMHMKNLTTVQLAAPQIDE